MKDKNGAGNPVFLILCWRDREKAWGAGSSVKVSGVAGFSIADLKTVQSKPEESVGFRGKTEKEPQSIASPRGRELLRKSKEACNIICPGRAKIPAYTVGGDADRKRSTSSTISRFETEAEPILKGGLLVDSPTHSPEG